MTVCVFYLSFVLKKINNNKTNIKMNEFLMTYMDELFHLCIGRYFSHGFLCDKKGGVKNTVDSRLTSSGSTSSQLSGELKVVVTTNKFVSFNLEHAIHAIIDAFGSFSSKLAIIYVR